MSGLANGGIYASLAVALVLIYRATEVINFAQGAIATFTTYIAWQLMDWGLEYWEGFALTLVIAFVGGFLLELVAIRPVERRGNQLTVVIAAIGLLILVEGAVGWIWGNQVKFMPSAFPPHIYNVGGVAFSRQDLSTIAISIAAVVVLWLFFQFTKVGLAMRAAAVRPSAARLVGVRVSWMLSLGWGLAAVLGAVAGMMAAASPSVLLQPTMMDGILIYAFAAAVLGGLESAAGAVVGALLIGVGLNLLSAYVELGDAPAAPAGGVRDHARRSARQAVRPVRTHAGAQGMRVRTSTAIGVAATLIVGAVIVLLPYGLSDYHRSTGATVAVYFTAILALNLVTGYTGQISIGHGAFMAVGGYATAILTHDHGWNDLATLPVSALCGFVAGVIVGLPALRLTGVYLALTTFAVALAVPQLVSNYPNFTGGVPGLSLPTHTGLWLYDVSWAVAGFVFVVAWLLLRGRTGRAFRAVRDSDIAAASSGISLPVYKTVAFGISAAMAALAGSMFVLVNNYVSPDDVRAVVVALHPDRRGRRRARVPVGSACGIHFRRPSADRANHREHRLVSVGTGALRGSGHLGDGPDPAWGRESLAAGLAFRIQDRSTFRHTPRHGGQMTRRMKGALVLAVFAIAAAAVSAAFASTSLAPGVTKTTITIGGTFPLTGPAALYGVIPKAESAYFSYVNNHGGVNGRKINFKYYDDGYNPANTVPLTKKLVQQDKVFAVYGSLGTEPILATRDYLNQAKVPQVLVATGDSYWATQGKKYPWTIGFQPDYPGESSIYGKFIASKVPQAKIGVLMQDDAYGENYYNGLVAGLGDSKSKIVDVEKYDATQTDVSSQIVKLKAAGANVVVLFSLPTQTIDALVVITKIGWKPVTFINNVSASPLFMGLAQKNGANVENDISATYLQDTINNPNTPTAKLYKSILSTYDSGADPNDANNLYGVASRVDDGDRAQVAGSKPDASGPDERADQHEQLDEPVPVPGNQDVHELD